MPVGTALPIVTDTRELADRAGSTDNVGVTRYTILRGGTVIAVVSGSVLSFTDRTTVASTAYSYTVKASDAAARFSAASSPAAVTTPALS